MMNKPTRHKSLIIDKLQQSRSVMAFEKTKKQMLLTAKIQDAVKAKGINNAKFAAMMDQHPSVISKWLSGTHNFTVDTLLDIEEKLGISLIALNEKKEPTIMQYVGAVRSNSNIKLEHLPSRGNTSFDFGLALSIKATPMQPHHKLSVPIFN